MKLFKLFKNRSKKKDIQKGALEQIGYLIAVEMDRKRSFRRKIKGTPLEKKILFIMQMTNVKNKE